MPDHTTEVPQKTCSKCGESKPATTEYFTLRTDRPNSLVSACKTCVAETGRVRRAADRKVREESKRAAEEADKDRVKEKVCSRCGENKFATVENFYRAKTGKYGLDAVCRACRAQQSITNREQIRERNRAYYETHKEQISEARRIFHAANKERLNQQSREWNQNNKEKRTEYNRNYWRQVRSLNKEQENERARERYNANREEIRKRINAYRKADKQKESLRRRIDNHRRRIRKLQAEGKHTTTDIQSQYNRQRGKCYYCGIKVGDTYDVDHIIPLSRGGTNWPDNIVIACPTCNASKGNKLLHEWTRGGRLL